MQSDPSSSSSKASAGFYRSSSSAKGRSMSTMDSLKQSISAELSFCNNELMSRDLICKGAISAVVGGALGILTSLIVNCTLVEISLSPFFALYFGCLFLWIGGVIFWRICGQTSEEAQSRKNLLKGFAILILISGCLCFTFEQNWFLGLNRIVKIPIYVLIGISVAFALTFSLVDLLNYSIGLVQHTLARPLVESKNQVFLVLIVSVLKGAIFGLVFGVMDVEDAVSYHIRLALLREEHFCYPIGAVLGAMAGFGNEYLRQKDELRNRKRLGAFDEDI